MNTFYFIVQQTMFFAIPLLVVGLGGMYSERSGVSNIGLEGIMIIGATAGVIAINTFESVFSSQFLFITAILTAGCVGLLYSLLHAWASIRLNADQTISGTALNIFAPAFSIFLARTMFGAKQIPFIDQFRIARIPVLSDIPFIGPCFFTNSYISTYIGFLTLVVLAVLFEKTRFGLRLCSCGENPDSAASVGISVSKMRYIGVAISGFLGGAGGLIFIVPTSTEFAGNVSGYGFLALAVIIMGQWKPVGILLSAFFFGLLKAFSSIYSGIPVLANLNVPSEIYKIVPYVLTIAVLAVSSGKSIAPKAEGQPYDDGNGFTASNGKHRVWTVVLVCAFILFNAVVIIGNSKDVKKNSVSSGYGADIALCINVDVTIDDKSYFQNEWEGIKEFTDKYNISRKYYQPQDASQEAFCKTVGIAIKGKAKVVIAGSNDYECAIYDIQDKYPEQKIILVDSIPKSQETGEVKIGPNTVCVSIAEQQAGFLAGYAAVMDGYRDLGFLGGVAVPAVKRYGYGYIAGADYAAQELGLKNNEVRIKYSYTGTFSASPEILAMASSWYQGGTEVIFSCGGAIGNSVMKAAEANGGKVIGVDSDQSEESTTVITSAQKEIGDALNYLLECIINGKATINMGEAEILTTAEHAVGLPMETSRFKRFTREQYEVIYEKLASGRIAVPDEYAAKSAEEIKVTLISIKEIR